MSFLRNSCLRKCRHSDYLSALQHAARLGDDGDLVIYPCALCAGLHVGHARPGTANYVRRGLRRDSAAKPFERSHFREPSSPSPSFHPPNSITKGEHARKFVSTAACRSMTATSPNPFVAVAAVLGSQLSTTISSTPQPRSIGSRNDLETNRGVKSATAAIFAQCVFVAAAEPAGLRFSNATC